MVETCTLAVYESLIKSNGKLKLEQLWHETFNQHRHLDDLYSILGTELGSFETFINSQPDLFTLNSDGEVCFTESRHLEQLTTTSHHEEQRRCSLELPPCTFDHELEAVRYFQQQLGRKSDRWVPISSLAGHLSQASDSIRSVVGSQSNFTQFLARNPLFFQVEGQLVSSTHTASSTKSSSSFNSSIRVGRKRPNYRLNQSRSTPDQSLIDRTTNQQLFRPSILLPSQPNRVFIPSLPEARALIWLKHVIDETLGGSTTLSHLADLVYNNAPMRDSIGWTSVELAGFLRKYPRIFSCSSSTSDDHLVGCNRELQSQLHLIIANNQKAKQPDNRESQEILLGQSGTIFCLNRLWGIIDLGCHEHVFFDKSLFKHVTDLTSHFELNESVIFNALLAPKDSRARWRATCVWKPCDVLSVDPFAVVASSSSATSSNNDDADSGLDNSESQQQPHEVVDRQLRIELADIQDALDHCIQAFHSLSLVNPSCTVYKPTPPPDVIPQVSGQCNTVSSSSSCSSSNRHRLSTTCCCSDFDSSDDTEEVMLTTATPISLTDLDNTCVPPVRRSSSHDEASPPLKHHHMDVERQLTRRRSPQQRTCATQTLCTGEIMATQLFHD